MKVFLYKAYNNPSLFAIYLILILEFAKISSFSYSRATYLGRRLAMSSASTGESRKLIKPLIDDRAYRLVDLDNGIRTLLIQDQQSLLSSCTLAVNVGAAADSLPGLAHMTEHAVFLGSAKYPVENEYKRFLSKNGGGSNGGTSMEYTNYKFYVKASAFEHTLDIFSQFFKSPTFAADALTREVLAVDAEDSKNRILDNRRLLQVLKSLIDVTDYRKFSTGNVVTLAFGDNVKYGPLLSEKVKAFHQQHYDPKHMTVCLAGPQSLDELEKLARQSFQDIEGQRPHPPSPSPSDKAPILSSHLKLKNRLVKVKPIKDIRDVSIIWEISPLKVDFAVTPCHLLEYILNFKGDGSLFACLQDKGLVTNLSCGVRTSFPDFALFEISASLTVEGLRQLDNVICYIDAYLDIIRRAETSEVLELWADLKQLRTLKFMFAEKNSLYETTPEVASNLLEYPPERALAGDFLLEELDVNAHHKLVDSLRLDQALAVVRSKDFDLPDDDNKFLGNQMQLFEKAMEQNEIEMLKQDATYFDRLLDFVDSSDQVSSGETYSVKKEVFYGVSYSLEPFTSKTTANRSVEDYQMVLPGKNKYFPHELLSQEEKYRAILQVQREEAEAELNLIIPQLVQSPSEQYWKSSSALFVLPKFVSYVLLPSVVTEDAHTLLSLTGSLFDQVAVRKYYDALVAGVKFDFTLTQRGILLTFFGFEPKLPDLMRDVCTDVANEAFWSSITAEMFENSKDRQLRSLSSWHKERPDSQAQTILNYILQENAYLPDSKIRMCSESTYEHFQQRIKDVLDNLSKPLFYIHGEEEARAESFVKDCLSRFSLPKESMSMPSLRSRELPKGKSAIVRLEPFNIDDPNSAAIVFFQADFNTPSISASLLVLRRLLAEPAFNYLRTQKQLGYIVSLSTGSFGRGVNAIRGLELKVLSKTHSAEDIWQEINVFLNAQERALCEELSEQDLQVVKEALRKNLQDPPNSLAEEAGEVWGYLANDLPLDWKKQVISELDQLDLITLRQKAKQWLFDDSSRRSVAIMIGKEDAAQLNIQGAVDIYYGMGGVKRLRNEIALPDERNSD